MYQWLLAPLEQDLQQLGIKNLVYIAKTELRSICHSLAGRPIARGYS
ncbi:MAG TPA: hypothetical protein V6D50_04035 [Chroococcales cyanobacterium]